MRLRVHHEDSQVKIAQLAPGMLLEPVAGYVWAETPWRGSEGKVVGTYLQVVSERMSPPENAIIRNEVVLYLGTTDLTSTIPTPGRQVVLAWGKKLTVDPTSWRNIKLNC